MWVLVAVALAVRLLLIALTTDYEPVFDADDYHRHGVSIAAGDGFPESVIAASGGPSAFRPPGYPFLLGGVYAVFGDSVTAGRVLGAVLGALTVLLTFLVGRRLFEDRVATVAAAVVAVLPPLAVLQTALLSEGAFLVAELLAVLAVLLLRESERPVGWAVLAGVLAGVVTLTRPNGALILIPLALGAWVLRPRGALRSLALPATVVACAALTCAPWAIRNTDAFDDFVPLTTQSGWVVSGTYNTYVRNVAPDPGLWRAPILLGEFKPLFDDPKLDEQELDAELRERGVDFAREHPEYIVKASVLNLLRIVGILGTPFSGSENFEAIAGGALGERAFELVRASTVLLLALAGAGALVLCLRGRRAWRPYFVWLVPLLIPLAAIPILGDPRYRTPADPFLAMLAAVALAVAFDRLRRRSSGADQTAAD